MSLRASLRAKQALGVGIVVCGALALVAGAVIALLALSGGQAPTDAAAQSDCTAHSVTRQYNEESDRLLVEWQCDGNADRFEVELRRAANEQPFDTKHVAGDKRSADFHVTSKWLADNAVLTVTAHHDGVSADTMNARVSGQGGSQTAQVAPGTGNAINDCKKLVYKVSSWQSAEAVVGSAIGNASRGSGEWQIRRDNVDGEWRWESIEDRLDRRWDGKLRVTVYRTGGGTGSASLTDDEASGYYSGGIVAIRYNGNEHYDPSHSHFDKSTQWCISRHGG